MSSLSERLAVLEDRVKSLSKVVWILVFVNLGDAGFQYAPDIIQNATRVINFIASLF